MSAPRWALWVVGPTIAPGDVPGLCADLVRLVRDTGATVVICDVSTITDPDLTTVEALARLHLTARRCGCALRPHRPGPRLTELLTLTGLRP